MLKIDLHLHSAEDPSDNIDYDAAGLVDRAARLGFDALAFTLHDAQLHDPALQAYARRRGITLLPGIERTIDGRHVLLVNFPREAEHVASFDDVRELKRGARGLVIAPHPLFPGGSPLGALLDAHADLFDAVEWSYFWTRGVNFNRRAAAWARARGLPVVGNSDCHDLRQLGRTFSLVEAARDPDAICDAIRQGRVELRTSPVPWSELAQVLTRLMITAPLAPYARPFCWAASTSSSRPSTPSLS